MHQKHQEAGKVKRLMSEQR